MRQGRLSVNWCHTKMHEGTYVLHAFRNDDREMGLILRDIFPIVYSRRRADRMLQSKLRLKFSGGGQVRSHSSSNPFMREV